MAFSGLFPAQGPPDWPHGVQEPDAPRFALEHVKALRPNGDGPGTLSSTEFVDEGRAGEIIDLFNRPIA